MAPGGWGDRAHAAAGWAMQHANALGLAALVVTGLLPGLLLAGDEGLPFPANLVSRCPAQPLPAFLQPGSPCRPAPVSQAEQM